MNQLIEPNLSVVGYPDYCLAYVEQVFGVQNDPDPDAWQGWLNTKFKHTDPIPADVSVPVWFSWTGTIGGITQNWGHVAVSTPQGVYTNPLSGSGHKVFPSVPALATAYGVKYVGWSEDIGNLKVIGGDMPTDSQIDDWISTQHQIAFGVPPTDAVFNSWRPVLKNNFVDGSLSLLKGIDTNSGALKNKPANATVLKPGNYQVN